VSARETCLAEGICKNFFAALSNRGGLQLKEAFSLWWCFAATATLWSKQFSIVLRAVKQPILGLKGLACLKESLAVCTTKAFCTNGTGSILWGGTAFDR
jgi:hypothetical protein